MASHTHVLEALLVMHAPMLVMGLGLELLARYDGDVADMEATTLDRLLLCARFPILVCHATAAAVVLQATPTRHRERVLEPVNWVMRSYGSRFYFEGDDERWVGSLVMIGDAPLGGR